MSAHSPNQFYDKLRTLVQIYRMVHMGTPAVDGSHRQTYVGFSPGMNDTYGLEVVAGIRESRKTK